MTRPLFEPFRNRVLLDMHLSKQGENFETLYKGAVGGGRGS